MNDFESFEDLFEIFAFKNVLTSLSDIYELVLENRAQVSRYTVITVM